MLQLLSTILIASILLWASVDLILYMIGHYLSRPISPEEEHQQRLTTKILTQRTQHKREIATYDTSHSN